jgi:hypothetical protein
MSTAAETAPLTTMASAMFFGSILFCAAALSARSIAVGDFSGLQQAAFHPRATALDTKSFVSIYTLLAHLSILGLIMFYAYVCEYHPPFAHAAKSYDRDEFFFLTALLMVVSAFTLKSHVKEPQRKTETKTSSDDIADGEHRVSMKEKNISPYSERAVAPQNDLTEVLNRDQTEEWKGWMQFMFLLYHYYHAEEVYNAIRIMITCYVWMTGFGNFSFFYLKGDYSAVRVMQMLWRLNFLVVFLCLTQGTTYILYYICLLHTYFFLMVYATMRVGKHLNYSKYGIRLKLGALALIIFATWDLDLGLFRALHWTFLGETPQLGANSGVMWEWYFRSTLDHWSTFLGMLFALNFPITSLFFRKLEAQPLHIHVAAKGIMAVVFIGASYWWVTGPFMLDKFDYNQTNSYYGWIPLISYIYLRNLTPWLRGHSLDLLHQIGKTTLETYLMQHHIWLTSDAKSLLTLVPGWPKMNFLVVSIIYVVLSRRLYQLTLFLRGMMLPNDRTACFRNLLYFGGALFSSVTLAAILRALEVLNLTSVAGCSLLFGGLLYKTICDHTVDASAPRPRNMSHPISFWSVGALAVLLVGMMWHSMATVGAGKIKPLPASCDEHVRQGAWISLDVCNENTMGSSYRDHGIGALGTCLPQTETFVWGWEAAPSASQCRVVARDAKSLLKTLKHRNVTFVGDSVIRHLYHATCRQVGDKSAGSYNTTVSKWTDFSRKYKSAAMEFRWAPFVNELTTTIQTIQRDKEKPDLVVLGGGAWDRLHRYGTQSDREAFERNVTLLAKEMKTLNTLGVPIAWVIPTTINSWALSDEKNSKRENIREDQMADVRALYGKKGVLDSASFLIDGPSFTAGRVAESYDGVHYPFSVYDAGAQILANALDWLLPEKDTSDPFHAPTPGTMANPRLGLMILGFVVIALFLCDGFMGASYLVGMCVPSAMPLRLYQEAFTTLHKMAGLPTVQADDSDESFKSKSSDGFNESKSSDGEDSDDERASFIQSMDKETELRVV